ncbi:hypothetical protein BQ8420_14210 [Nocardiopsis sp. JB363]|nr:hypothetical protein BQ8420_14210 [Nocardiopsis sp. JB363]
MQAHRLFQSAFRAARRDGSGEDILDLLAHTRHRFLDRGGPGRSGMGVKEAHTLIICQCHRERQTYSPVYSINSKTPTRLPWNGAHCGLSTTPFSRHYPHRCRPPRGRGPPRAAPVAGPS